MSAKSVITGAPVSLDGLESLVAILAVISDKSSIERALKPIIEEREKLSKERAAVGSLSQINSLRAEAVADRDKAADELRQSITQRNSIVGAADEKAVVIVEKAEALASHNATWAKELETRHEALVEASGTLAHDERAVKQRENAAAKLKEESDDLIAESVKLNTALEAKLDAVTKAAA